MGINGAKRQTLFLTGINAIVRALGLALRVLMSRMLGAEIMGIAELAQSVHMVAITPLTSGMPAAISRMTARASSQDRSKPLFAGVQMVRLASCVLIPLLWLLSPWLSKLMGDVRVLPSLWWTAPCILVLGYSAAYNGYCYGIEKSLYPAMSELIEQVMRLVLTLLLLMLFSRLTAAWLASIPVLATLLSEVIGLIYVLVCVKPAPVSYSEARHWRRPILELALPTTASRLIQTLLRSWTAILIPVRLHQSGLTTAEATAQLGMLNGMVMPILMLPCVFTSALSMVAIPRLAQAEEQPGELKRLLGLCALGCIPVAALCGGITYVCAPILSNLVYRQPELMQLFRMAWPMTVLFAATHLCGSILSALGLQKQSLYASSLVALTTLGLTWLWAGERRLEGVILAQAASQLLTLASSAFIFLRWRHKR